MNLKYPELWPVLLSDLVRGAAAKRPDHAALVFGETTLTYAHLAERVARAARGLVELISPARPFGRASGRRRSRGPRC